MPCCPQNQVTCSTPTLPPFLSSGLLRSWAVLSTAGLLFCSISWHLNIIKPVTLHRYGTLTFHPNTGRCTNKSNASLVWKWQQEHRSICSLTKIRNNQPANVGASAYSKKHVDILWQHLLLLIPRPTATMTITLFKMNDQAAFLPGQLASRQEQKAQVQGTQQN